MREDYLIHILGQQETDGEKDEICLSTVGSFALRGGHHYITYREYYDESNPSVYRTSILKVEGNRSATLLYSGSATRLILEEGKRHYCQYDTGYGMLTIGTYAQEIDNRLDDHGGTVHIRYTLDMNASYTSFHEITVTVKPTS